MTSANDRAVQFKGVGDSDEETTRNIQEALDQLAAKIPAAQEVPGTVENQSEPVRRLVRVSTEVPSGFDEGLRFLRCTTPVGASSDGPVEYEFFRDGLKIASQPRIPVGYQFSRIATLNSGGSSQVAALSCNVFMAVVYDIPWVGRELPYAYQGPMTSTSEADGKCSVGDVLKSSATPANTFGFTGSTDKWGNPLGDSGTLTWSGSNIVAQAEAPVFSGLEWTVTPFFFYDGMEEECKEFLGSMFTGGVTTGQAKRCLTTNGRFSALVVARRVMVSAGGTTLSAPHWRSTAGDALTQSDTERAKWTVKLSGHQTVVVS